jgi:hypothetical protein
MNQSFAKTLKFQPEPADSGVTTFGTSDTVQASGQGVAEKQAAPSASFRVPTFDAYGRVYAIEARRAGRLNAANASDEERRKLLQERQQLLDKKLDGKISRREANRLEYVRWSLDRIDDARSGEAMDDLENLISQYEQFRRDIAELGAEIAKRIAGDTDGKR